VYHEANKLMIDQVLVNHFTVILKVVLNSVKIPIFEIKLQLHILKEFILEHHVVILRYIRVSV